MAAFCNVVLCSLEDADQSFRGAYCLLHQGGLGMGARWTWQSPGWTISLHGLLITLMMMMTVSWNAGQYLSDYTVQHPRRQLSSFLLLWKCYISVCFTVLPLGRWYALFYMVFSMNFLYRCNNEWWGHGVSLRPWYRHTGTSEGTLWYAGLETQVGGNVCSGSDGIHFK